MFVLLRQVTLKGHTGRVCGLSTSPNGRAVVTASGDQTMR